MVGCHTPGAETVIWVYSFWQGNLMCLAIPGKVLEVVQQDGISTGRVQFGGIIRSVCLDFVPEAKAGDYVVVHVGFAISRVDEAEAARTYQLLEEMGVLQQELPPADQP